MSDVVNKWWDYYMGDEVWVAVYTEQTRPKYKTKIDERHVSPHIRDKKIVAYTLRVKEGTKKHQQLFDELKPVKVEADSIKKRKSKKGD